MKNKAGLVVASLSVLLLATLGGVVNWFVMECRTTGSPGFVDDLHQPLSFCGAASTPAFEMTLICTLVSMAGVGLIVYISKYFWSSRDFSLKRSRKSIYFRRK